MLTTVDRRPRYRQAADALAKLLESSYEPGSLLPSADLLAQQIGVSRSTLREAMGYLEHEGRVIRKQGVGTFIATSTPGHLVNRLEQLSGLRSLATNAQLPMEVVEFEAQMEPAAEDAARILGLECGAPLAHTHVVVSIGGRRIAYFDSRVSADAVDLDRMARDGHTLLEHLLQRGGQVPSYTDTRILVAKASHSIAARLGIALDDPILLMNEVFYSDRRLPVLWQHAYLLAEYVDYRLVRRVTAQIGQSPHG